MSRPLTLCGGEMEPMRKIIRKIKAEEEMYISHPVYADGAKLRRLMREQDLSGAELSRRSGVSASVINRLRRNQTPERFVERHHLRKVAAALSVSVEDLL